MSWSVPATSIGCDERHYRVYYLVEDAPYTVAMIALSLLAAPALCLATIHDGDTVRSCEGERIRIANIDAPEMRGSPKCRRRSTHGWCDYALAERSRDSLAAFLASGRISIRRSGTDRYGRTLATLAVDGRNVGTYLIERHLARPWR